MDTKREEEKKTVDVGGSENGSGDGEGIEKSEWSSSNGREKVSFGGEEENRSARGKRKKREGNETTERFEVAREFGSASGGKRTRELDMAIGNMSLREMQFNDISV